MDQTANPLPHRLFVYRYPNVVTKIYIFGTKQNKISHLLLRYVSIYFIFVVNSVKSNINRQA